MKNNVVKKLAVIFLGAIFSPSAFCWQAVTNGLPSNPTISRLVAGGNLAALNVSSGSPAGVYVSTNSGLTWFKTATLPGSTQQANDLFVVSNTLFVVRNFQAVGTNIIMFSSDYGTTWIGGTNIANSTAINLIASDDAVLFAGSTANGTIWRSTNSGVSWDIVGTGAGNFGNGTLRALGGHGGRIVAAMNTGLYTLMGSGTNWTKITGDNNVFAGTHMAWQADRIFMNYGDTGRRAIALLDGTTNIFNATNGLAEGYLNFFTAYRDFAVSSSSVFDAAQLLNASTFVYEAHVYETLNGGTNWFDLPLPSGKTDVPCVAVISNNLFAQFSATVSGLYRITLQDGQPVFEPTFTTNPASAFVVPGVNVTFTAGVTSSVPVNLQWRKNDMDIFGETNLSLTLSGVTTNDAGSYTLAAWNIGGTNVSGAATLGVIPPGPGHLNLSFNPGAFGYDYGTGTNNNGTVSSVVALTNGQIVIGGSFTHVNMTLNSDGTVSGGVRSQKIARLNADGSVDTSFMTSPGFGLNDTIGLIVVAPDNSIYVGGQFTSYNGVNVTNLLRLNADGSLDSGFTPAFLPANNFAGSYKRIQPLPDGHVIISGTFTNVNGTARTNIVCLNQDGTVDTNWFSGGGLTYQYTSVSDFALSASGDVWIGGSFLKFEGTGRNYLVAVSTNGMLNTNFNQTLDGQINELNPQPGGLLWALGSFTKYTNGVAIPVTQPVRIYPDGMVVGSSPTNLLYATKMFSQADGHLIISFYDNNTGNYRLIRFNADGFVDDSFDTTGGFNSSLSGMAMTPSGSLFVAGNFSSFGGAPVSGGLACLYAAETNITPDKAVITLTPPDAIVATTSNEVLRAAALSSAPLKFSWLQNGAPVIDATNAALTLTNFSALKSGAYQLVASNLFGATTSAVFNVSLAVAPSITNPPPAFTGATNGGMVVLSAGVSGSAPLFFQWYQNNIKSAGATNNPFTISNLTSGWQGNWTLVVSNLYGSATSSVVNVQIGTAPNIFTQPANQTLYGTGNVTTIAGVSGSTPLFYQWYQNNVPVPGQNTNRLYITNAVPTDAGSYYLVVTNFVGSVTSVTRTVTIYNPYFSSNPSSRSAPEGSDTNFVAVARGTDPITYFWYQRKVGSFTNLYSVGSSNAFFVNLNRTNGGQYFVIASNVWGSVTSSYASLTVDFKPAITNIIPGTNIVVESDSSLYINLQFEASPYPNLYWYKDNVFQPSLTGYSTLTFNPAQTNQSGVYQLVASNYVGSVTSAPITLTIKPPRGPTITNEPGPRIVKVGDTFTLSAGVDGTPYLHYALFKQGVGQVGNWSFNSMPYVTATATNFTGNYYFIVTNNYGSATSMLASVTVIQPQPATFTNKQFVKIADSQTVIPGLSPTAFYGSFRDAFIRGSDVWFGGSVSGVPFSMGVYHWSNNIIAKLVDTNSFVPGSSSRFTNFYGSTFLSDGKVIFVGNGSGYEHGLYAWTNNSIIKLYDTNTVMPGTSLTFERFGWPSVVGNQFAFLGFNGTNYDFTLDYRGVFVSSNGVLSVLADTNTVLPGLGGHFYGSSSQVGFDGSNVVWWAWNEATNYGIFRVQKNSSMTDLADQFTVNPASGLNFENFISPPTIYNGRTYLVGHGSGFNTALLYRDIGGALTVVSKPGDTVPSRGITFGSVGYPAQASSSAGVFFDGTDNAGYYGIFYWNGSTTVKVIDSLDSLDGLAISYVYVADADADNLLFYVNFTNGKTALYALIPATGQTFNEWAAQYNFPSGQSNPEDDADSDGVPNIFEYYFGSNPTNSTSGAQPTETKVNDSGTDYPAITFIRSQNATGVTLIPEVSSSVSFTDSLGSTVESVVDLGNGTERVTIRSNVSMATQITQFLRIGLTVP